MQHDFAYDLEIDGAMLMRFSGILLLEKIVYLCTWFHHRGYAEDKAWMQQYGCVQVIEEMFGFTSRSSAFRILRQARCDTEPWAI